jgi:hypothetical protein
MSKKAKCSLGLRSNQRKTIEGCITSMKHFRIILIHYFRFTAENITYIFYEDKKDTLTDREILDELCKMVKGAQKKHVLQLASQDMR